MSAADTDDEVDLAQARRVARALGLDARDVARALHQRRDRRVAAARRRRAWRWALGIIAAALLALLTWARAPG
ncbi:MAG: hypothetical protein H6704_24490 [Myxococcales bacterium]|nr:hypothetical protein [Myxococcales bacterium]